MASSKRSRSTAWQGRKLDFPTTVRDVTLRGLAVEAAGATAGRQT